MQLQVPASCGYAVAMTGSEGLRARKKRLMRQQLSDTATEMFLRRGFDAVRVAEIAEACGVSEQTVFNYFPTKESLLLDRSDATRAALRASLSDPATPPVAATLKFLADDLACELARLAGEADQAAAIGLIRRFDAVVEGTASVRAHQRDLTEQLVVTATEVLAGRAGLDPCDPRPRIVATALVGLVEIQSLALKRHLVPGRHLAEVREAVTADVRTAAGLVESGMAAFPPA
jgi:AcrR family transcriptional regulator